MTRFSRRAPNRGNSHKASEGVTGFRSGLEGKLSDHFAALGVDVLYEQVKIRYVLPARSASYTPDWLLVGSGIIVESKGIFEVEDRQKHLLIQHQHPGLDIRFVFSRSATKLYKGSPTTYAKWCETHGFLYADKLPPADWLAEPPSASRFAAIKAAAEEPDLARWAHLKLATLSKR